MPIPYNDFTKTYKIMHSRIIIYAPSTTIDIKAFIIKNKEESP